VSFLDLFRKGEKSESTQPPPRKQISDETNVIRVGKNYVLDPKLWDWVNLSARQAFEHAQDAVRRKQPRGAVTFYVAASEFEPRWYAPYYELGSLFYGMNDIPHAAPLLAKSIELEPSWPAAYFNLSQCYKFSGNLRAALELLHQYVQLDPTDPEGYHAMGCIYMHTGDTARENEAYEAALRVYKDYIPSHLNLGVNHRLAGRKERARYHLRKVLDLLSGPAAMDMSAAEKQTYSASAQSELRQL
jgi:tetratricopeptide (TPR) repeat protein